MSKEVVTMRVWRLGLKRLALSVGAAAVLSGSASAQTYLVTDLGTLGGSSSAGVAINAAGQVTGDAPTVGDGAWHGFLTSGEAVKGNFRYRNHATGDTIDSAELTDLLVYGTDAIFSGTGTDRLVPRTFTVQVSDRGEPGTNETFSVTLGGVAIGGVLGGGNVQIHHRD